MPLDFDPHLDKRFAMVDVKSLYPFVMLNRWYPCGETIEEPYEVCRALGRIGFYEVTFSQENCKKNVLPRKTDAFSLDWNYKGEMTQFINTVDI